MAKMQNIKTPTELLRVIKDLPIPPDITNKIFRLSDRDIANQVRKKVTPIIKLLYVDDIYSEYGEGWIPIYLLPGSMIKH